MAKPLAGISHFLVLFAFLTVNILLPEVLLEGITGIPRPFSRILGNFYALFTIPGDIFIYLGIIGIIIFAIRRYIIRPFQFRTYELGGWQHFDALIDLIAIFILLGCMSLMNAAESMLAEHEGELKPWFFPASRAILGGFLPFTPDNLHTIRHIWWWCHILMVFFFLWFLPFSKHYHIFMAFVYLYLHKPSRYSHIGIAPFIIEQVKALMEGRDIQVETSRYGARDVLDLDAMDIIGAYACTECGRCTASCPASLTGKKLSPRKIMMNVRERCEEMLKRDEGTSGKTLLHGWVTPEELFACTTCMACLEACPVNLRPLDIIIKLRTNLVMEESNMPQAWISMISAMQGNGAPWQLPPEERTAWIKNI